MLRNKGCGRKWVRRSAIRRLLIAAAIATTCGAAGPAQAADSPAFRPRIEKALDQWCRWLSGNLYKIPGTDLYTLNPTRGTGNNPYRDVAGNQFAAAAAGYWLARHEVDEKTAEPLRGLIRLCLGTHVAVGTIDRPDVSRWGASLTFSDDWHADLFACAQAMLLLPDALPPEQRKQMEMILQWEADKQVEYGISKDRRTWPARSPDHSCGESNAWSAALLQAARVLLPESGRDDAWRESAIQYSLNAMCVPADVTSDRIVGGKPLRERVKGANFEPGGIQEHHGFYHPGYMGWPLAYEAFAHVCDRQLPESRRNPDVYLHNWKLVFDRLKQSTFHNGRFIHCAGDDWITYGYGNTQFFPATIFAAAQFRDPDAALMAEEWLKLIEHQQSLGGGSVLAARLATFQRLKINDFAWYEAQEGCCLAQALWLLDRIDSGAIPAPSTPGEFNRRNVGTYIEPNANLAWHRDEHRWASASWRSAFKQWQFIIQPVQLPHLLKFNHNGLGLLEISGVNNQHAIKWFRMDTFKDGGFWSLGQIDRQSKRITKGPAVFPLVRQYQAIAALPEGPTVFVDLCQAADQLWILRDGGIGLRLAADIFNDNAARLTVGGEECLFSQATCNDTWHDLGSRSITIEKLLTVHALAGEGTFQLKQKSARPADRSRLLHDQDTFGVEESLLTHELYFGPPAYERPRIIAPDELFRRQVTVFYCDPATTPARPAGEVAGQFPCLTVSLPDVGRTVAVNFGEQERKATTPAGAVTVPARSVVVIQGGGNGP
ncbi:MAG TPA: hypothetical protein VLM89_17820 [Phycisphaerae bacterium]|nr:hypothetical protein [Phycisphaerae bacterium]